ncbi:hypothetical protein F5Y08DRAFT_316686 [Xylaria arbuscula]|nr:hypothetical protein F5Y08DRAFT_316686 [Xylaria arbuscula]
MTFAYYSDGRRYVHGDCPVSRLTAGQIGDVAGVPFYVHVYLKKKSGEPAKVTFLDTEEKGYVHCVRERDDVVDEGSDDNFGFEMISTAEADEASGLNEDHESVLERIGKLSLSDKGSTLESRDVERGTSTDKDNCI